MNVVNDARCYNTIQKQSDGLRNALQGMKQLEVESCMVVVKKTNNIINFQDALNVFTPIFFSSTHPVIRDPTSAQKITIITSKNHPKIWMKS